MRRVFFNFLALFIPVRRWRHEVKRLRNKGDGYLQKVAMENLKNILSVGLDLSKCPPARGVMAARQQANLKLLGAFDRLCQENKIDYWLSAGDIIGKIRHNGPIPWDDDIDVGVCGDDWNKIVGWIRTHLPNKDFRLAYNTHNFFQIVHRSGAYLDIFHYDYFTRDIDIAKDKKMIMGRYKKFFSKYAWKMHKHIYFGFDESAESLNKKWEFVDRHEKMLAGMFYEIMLEGEEKNQTCGGIICASGRGDRELYKREIIFPTQKLEYGGRKVRFPGDLDGYAVSLYGDIWQFPPDVLTHHKKKQNVAGEYFMTKDALAISDDEFFRRLTAGKTTL